MVGIAALIGVFQGHLLDIFLRHFYTGEPVLQRPLRCQACGARANGAYLLPFVGYLLSAGRCSGCRALLPLRVLLLPAGSSLTFALAYLALDDLGAALLAGFFCAVFLAFVFTDLDERLIPNRIVYPAILAAMALSWGWPDRSVGEIFAGGGLALVIGALIYVLSRSTFGLGDVKLIILIGLTSGFPSLFLGLFVGVLSAGAVAAVLLLFRVLRRGDYMPYGPFLSMGGIISTIWGPQIF